MLIAMDCEMVGSGNQGLLARVSIVNWQGSVLLDTYVKPTVLVTDYRTPFSGITKEHLDSGKSFNVVQSAVSNLLSGRLLVGHSLHFDLNALELSHPVCDQRDLAKYGPFMKNGQPQSLRILAQKYLNKYIQDGEHDSMEDARIAMELYKLVAHSWN